MFAAHYIGAKPMTVSFTNGIDTLHGTTRQELHQILSISRFSLLAAAPVTWAGTSLDA
jgi:hypothetical protein